MQSGHRVIGSSGYRPSPLILHMAARMVRYADDELPERVKNVPVVLVTYHEVEKGPFSCGCNTHIYPSLSLLVGVN